MAEAMRPPLLIAESANPEWSSVPLVGWSHAMALRALTGGHIVTQVRNAGAFERAGVPVEAYTALDTERIAGAMYRVGRLLRGGSGKGWTTQMAASLLSYAWFERLVWRRFGARLRAGEFSVVHRLTPLSPTLPSLLAGRCARAGVPFVWGPINGGVPWPEGFGGQRRREREWLSYVRDAYKLVPGYASTRRHAASIIAASLHTQGELRGPAAQRSVYIPENGIDPQRFSARRVHGAARPLRCVFLGRLVPYKGADMLIEAAAPLAAKGLVNIEIVGDGPERPRLESMIRAHGLEGAVRLIGAVPHTEVQHRLAAADLLTFPSIREFGGGVILEAMAVGLPPMAVAYGGPGELMTPASSFPIELGTRPQLIERFRAGLEAVLADPAEIDRRSAAAYERAWRLFTWEAKARQVREVYRWVLGERPDKPVFDFG